MADGTLRFDTEIDESGFQKGLKRIEQAAKGATQQTASDAQDAAKQAEQAVSQAAEEAGKDAEKAAKQVENALEDVQDAAEDAADAVTDAAENAGQDAAESVQDAVDNIVESVEEAGESAAEAVEDAMSDVVDSVSDAAKDVGDSASDIGDSIGDGFEEGTDQASTAIDALAQALVAAGVTASVKAITDALMGCTQESTKFKTAMAKVGTIADETQEPLGDMRNEILALSGETGKSVEELAEAAYQAISASVATESAVNFTSKANKLAVGGFSDTTTAVDILTTAINAYGMSADDAAKISDVLITTQNLGKTSVAQLGASMGMVIPLAAAYNMDLEDLSASYALLTARVSVDSSKLNQHYSQIVVTLDAEPYKLARKTSLDDWEWDSFNFETDIIRDYKNIPVPGEITVVGDVMPTGCVFEASAAVTVTYDGKSYQIPKGHSTVPDILITEGSHTMQFEGDGGTVSVEYRGGRF